MNIGSVARQSGVTVETLRYYEREGLIVPAGRDANGSRRFEQEAVRRVRFIKRAQEAGFSLKDINGLLRSKEHTSELQSLMRISYAVICLKKKQKTQTHINTAT